MIGCGTSLYMAQSFAVSREAAGARRDRRLPRIRVAVRPPVRPLIAISRSGTTTEVVARSLTLARRRADHGDHRGAGPPVAQAAGSVVAMTFADERSVVQTRFATSALVLLRGHVGIE